MLNQEIWKDIQGYEGKYQVSSFGNIRNVRTGKKLKGINKDGYAVVWLYLNGKAKRFYLHRLISDLFLINPNSKPFINHKNGIKNDNRIENLEWVTHLENMQHAHRSGFVNYEKITGENNPACKLSEAKILLIRKENEGGVSQLELAEKYRVTRRLINKIINRKLWRNI